MTFGLSRALLVRMMRAEFPWVATLVFVAASSVGCAPAPAPAPAVTSAEPIVTTAEPTAPPPSATAWATAVEPRLACNADADCSSFYSCDFQRCIVSSVHPHVCPTPCPTDPCRGHGVACRAGACVLTDR